MARNDAHQLHSRAGSAPYAPRFVPPRPRRLRPLLPRASRVVPPRSVRPCHGAACPASTACADLMSGRSQGDYFSSASTSQASHRISRMGLESRSRPGRPQRSHVSSLRCFKGSTRLSSALSSSLVQEPGPGQGRGPAGVLAAW